MRGQFSWLVSMLGHYTSTYCIHDSHVDCRLNCKTCGKPCRCACHRQTDVIANA